MKYNLNELSLTELLELRWSIDRDPRMRHYEILRKFEEKVRSAAHTIKLHERLGMGRISLNLAFMIHTVMFSNTRSPRAKSLKVEFEIIKKLVPEYSWKDVLRVVRYELNK